MKKTIAAISLALTAATAATTATADQFSECLVNEAEAEAGATMNRAQRFSLESQAELLGENFREVMKRQGMTAPQSIEFFRRLATKEGIMDEGVAYILMFSMTCAKHLDRGV